MSSGQSASFNFDFNKTEIYEWNDSSHYILYIKKIYFFSVLWGDSEDFLGFFFSDGELSGLGVVPLCLSDFYLEHLTQLEFNLVFYEDSTILVGSELQSEHSVNVHIDWQICDWDWHLFVYEGDVDRDLFAKEWLHGEVDNFIRRVLVNITFLFLVIESLYNISIVTTNIELIFLFVWSEYDFAVLSLSFQDGSLCLQNNIGHRAVLRYGVYLDRNRIIVVFLG